MTSEDFRKLLRTDKDCLKYLVESNLVLSSIAKDDNVFIVAARSGVMMNR